MWVSAPLFRDRLEAGRRLADAFRKSPTPDVVVGLARGGVQVAVEVARALKAPLDVVAVRKVGHPLQPEYAIGAVAPPQAVYLRASDGLSEEEVAKAVGEAQRAAEILDRRLHENRPPLDLEGAATLLVDDGLATGATMIAAVRWARGQGAKRVIAGVPVAAEQSVELLRPEVDELVAVYELPHFGAVGLWYETFAQVTDDEVLRLLEAGPSTTKSAATA